MQIHWAADTIFPDTHKPRAFRVVRRDVIPDFTQERYFISRVSAGDRSGVQPERIDDVAQDSQSNDKTRTRAIFCLGKADQMFFSKTRQTGAHLPF